MFCFSENNIISVWNNGKGIPVVEHKVEKVYVPALIFGQLLTSSNYDDDQKKVTGTRKSRLITNHSNRAVRCALAQWMGAIFFPLYIYCYLRVIRWP